jgi:hypothetical protein
LHYVADAITLQGRSPESGRCQTSPGFRFLQFNSVLGPLGFTA